MRQHSGALAERYPDRGGRLAPSVVDVDDVLNEVVLLANSAWYLKNFRSTTIVALRERGYAVCCIVPESSDAQSLQALRQLGGRVECFRFAASSISYRAELISLLSLMRVLRRLRPALVFSFNPKSNLYAAIACSVLGLAYVPNVSGVGMADQLRGLKGRLYRRAMGIFMRRARWVFFQNPENMDALIGRNWVDARRCTLLPGSGVELERFTPPQQELTPRGERVFLMAARLLKQKGVGEYLAAVERLQQEQSESFRARYLLAGEQDDSGRCIEPELLEAFASREGCEYLGQVEDMPGLLKRVDCVVLPSYYPEGVPRVLIEAIACGRPVITTEQPGCREVVEPGLNGYRIEPRSADALYEAMRSFLALPARQVEDMGRHSRRLAELRFDVRTVIEAYMQVAERFARNG